MRFRPSSTILLLLRLNVHLLNLLSLTIDCLVIEDLLLDHFHLLLLLLHNEPLFYPEVITGLVCPLTVVVLLRLISLHLIEHGIKLFGSFDVRNLVELLDLGNDLLNVHLFFLLHRFGPSLVYRCWFLHLQELGREVDLLIAARGYTIQ